MAVNLDALKLLALEAQTNAARLTDAITALQANQFGSFEEPLTAGQKTNIKNKGKTALAKLTSLVDQMNTEING